VPVGQPHVVQRPGQVADLRRGGQLAGHRDEAVVVAVLVGAATQTRRVGPVLRAQPVDEDLLIVDEGTGDRIQFQVIGAVDQPVLELDVEVPPDPGPRGGLQPRSGGRHHRSLRPRRTRDLVELDPVEALQLPVGDGEEALAVVPVPPVPVPVHQPAGARAGGAPDGLHHLRGRPGLRIAVRHRQVQHPVLALGALLVGGGRLAAGDHRLGHQRDAVDRTGDRVRVGDQRGGWGLPDDPRAERLFRYERPGEAVLASAGSGGHQQQRKVVLDQCAQRDGAPVGGHRPGHLGVPEVQP
jgi:hypothetical protein